MNADNIVILIEVLGGVVQQVRCTNIHAEVILLDHDLEKDPEYAGLDGDDYVRVDAMQDNDDLIVY